MIWLWKCAMEKPGSTNNGVLFSGHQSLDRTTDSRNWDIAKGVTAKIKETQSLDYWGKLAELAKTLIDWEKKDMYVENM